MGGTGGAILATGRKAAATEVSSEPAKPQVAPPAGLDQLTQRQVEVLRLLARGMTNAEIAEALFLSRRTVHAHLRTIFHKLNVGNRSAATRYAIQHGLL
jgi:DNA-binding NarL/FixJ family response regulator